VSLRLAIRRRNSLARCVFFSGTLMTEDPMKQRMVATIGAARGFALPLFAQDVGTDETDIDLSEVPPAVMEAARNAVDVEITYARTEREPGGLTYEVGGRTADGLNVEVDLLEDATVEEVERELPTMDDVPAEIRDALMADYADFEVEMIEEVWVNERVLRYEFEGTAGDEARVIEVTTLGNILDVTEQE